jgi:hypothetical protein
MRAVQIQSAGATKVCRGCQKALPATLEAFPPHTQGQFGLNPRCRPCKKADDAARRARPDQQARQQAWRDGNRAKVRQYNAEYRAGGYTSTEHVRRWRADNLDAARQADRRKIARYRREHHWHKLKSRISARVLGMLKGCGGKSQRRTEDLLGYSMKELQKHIERQFTPGMTWEAFQRGEIHIDHIIPVASFKPSSSDCPEFRACWALTNLRPLWAKDNIRKGSKREFLL